MESIASQPGLQVPGSSRPRLVPACGAAKCPPSSSRTRAPRAASAASGSQRLGSLAGFGFAGLRGAASKRLAKLRGRGGRTGHWKLQTVPTAAVPTGADAVSSSRAESASADVVVIGSGLAGLTCAGVLAAAGKSVTVLESHYVPGGAVRA